jgi:hypothetical protein
MDGANGCGNRTAPSVSRWWRRSLQRKQLHPSNSYWPAATGFGFPTTPRDTGEKATRTEALRRIPEARLKVLIPPQIGLEMLFPLEPTSTTGC